MPWLTVMDNVAFAVRSREVDTHSRKYIEMVGLKGAEAKKPAVLSGGMKQRDRSRCFNSQWRFPVPCKASSQFP